MSVAKDKQCLFSTVEGVDDAWVKLQAYVSYLETLNIEVAWALQVVKIKMAARLVSKPTRIKMLTNLMQLET